MKIGIVNVTGYGGIELARILYTHPDVEIKSITGRSAKGKRLGDIFPHLSDIDLVIKEELEDGLDIVFSGLPHKASAEVVSHLIQQGLKVIDISADFRLNNSAEYEEWYKVAHPCPQYLEQAVFGLPELMRKEISSAQLVANPGCYSTSAILALAPAIKAGIIEPEIIIDGKSGVSGAGRSLSLNTHFSEVNESIKAYSLNGHRHLPEITQELGKLNKSSDLKITFLTHLIPITRGILNSCYAPLKDGVIHSGDIGIQEVQSIYKDFYHNEPFTKVVDEPPMTKHTLGNNNCLIYPTIDLRTNRLIVISCIDNLVKGAAGQAIQNMNLMLGIPETSGLNQLSIYP